MPVDLLTATDAATEFLRKAGHVFPRLENAEFDQGKNAWVLRFDVGIGKPQSKKVTLDTAGKILSLE